MEEQAALMEGDPAARACLPVLAAPLPVLHTLESHSVPLTVCCTPLRTAPFLGQGGCVPLCLAPLGSSLQNIPVHVPGW
eukprot:CAMPEP_0206218290 /NCGR_PEP_ID=MMETSP0047_2-20121206/3721_1 /ASSEMBLY_ACC=CAM_ASM_000192 /TAXON_ID=195065 /ORGANISM="Chroomonas mesostigmatica_cf, Strain CCMP1168" /LENGTH=78 /DNA_ID=CAMNT_0053640785 /DNA_START=603 /DNA_END=836 /DNA_ORIENTATION=-